MADMTKGMFIAVFLLISPVMLNVPPADALTIKFATVVPEGGPGAVEAREMLVKIREETGGELDIKTYTGGVAGDEVDIIRKMRSGLIHMAAFSAVGLRQIMPWMTVIEAPGLYRIPEETGYVRARMFDELAADMRKRGFILLALGEGGFTYFYSRHPLQSPGDMERIKMWVWKGDPMMKTFMDTFGMKSVPLHIMDVNMGLETGMVDSFSGPPMIAIAFQWYTHARHMLNLPMVNVMGAVLMNRDVYEKLSQKSRDLMKEYMNQYYNEAIRVIRQLNEDSFRVLKEAGVSIDTPSAEHLAVYEDYFEKIVETSIREGLYTREQYMKVRGLVEEYRRLKPEGYY